MSQGQQLPFATDVDHPVILGKSFQTNNVKFHTIQYTFLPHSIDLSQDGLLVKDEGSVTLEYMNSQGERAVTLKGQYSECKDVECLLVYEDGVFRLEKITSATKNLMRTETPLAPVNRSVKRKRPEESDSVHPPPTRPKIGVNPLTLKVTSNSLPKPEQHQELSLIHI
eukprot:TRINITY_DN379_c0_g1_i3.p1 TRINITY_DN379_c0_g1~~TRINITY_DN379_c0_g1_i3.p1  ORF type:complete len:168 (-),score=20.19 TRINITY_DN379_c0_g1_i3:29-532(-)